MMGTPLALRAREAAQNLAEALAVGQKPLAGAPPAPQGAPMAGPAQPPGPPPGALAPRPPMPGPQPGMAPPGPHPSPLQGLPSFKSPPLASFLQGPQGATAQTAKPVGFAKGGLVMAAGGGAWTRKEGKNPEFRAADIGITGTDYWN